MKKIEFGLLGLVMMLALSSGVWAANIDWAEKGSAWDDPANWIGGRVPGPDDVAVFPGAGDPIPGGQARGGKTVAVQPVVTGKVSVSGIVLGNAPEIAMPIPGARAASAGWIIGGTGTIAVGKQGITLEQGNSIIHPALELTVKQDWTIGHMWSFATPLLRPWAKRDSIDAQLMIIVDWGTANPCNLILYGDISGPGGICKLNKGKVYCFTDNSPTFAGGTQVCGGTLAWVLSGLTGSKECSFGTAPIVLNGGFFNFSTNNGSLGSSFAVPTNPCVNTKTIRLSNAIDVLGLGGGVQCSQHGPIGEPQNTPTSLFSGPLDLRGMLTVVHQGWAGAVLPEFDGPIIVDQSVAATPGISCTAGVTMGRLDLTTPITDGPGNAGNPLVLRNYYDGITISNPHNTYEGPTISTYTGGEEGISNRYGIIFVAPQGRLGNGDLLIEPGGQVRLAAPGNLADGAQVDVGGNCAVMGVLGVGYNGVPRLTADSHGILAVECDGFDAVTDLSKLGNGHMRLGARDVGVFTGTRLAPGADNLYRLGGGGSGGAVWNWQQNLLSIYKQSSLHSPASGVLKIEHGVLQGTAGVEVGQVCRLGNGAVLLEGANTFAGLLTVQGPDEVHEGGGWPGSVLEGIAQTTPGQSPFGSSTGSVRLLDSTLRLTGVAGGQPVVKGPLVYAGNATIELDSQKKGPASLSVTSLTPEGRSVLFVGPTSGTLGDQEKMLVTDWKKNVDLLPPNLLYCSHNKKLDFLSYDATSGKGLVRFQPTAKDLLHAKETDVVEANGIALDGGTHTIRALKSEGITGGGTIRVLNGGVILDGTILTGDIDPDLDFGNVPGVVCAAGGVHVLRGKVSGSQGITATSTTDHGFHEGLGLVNFHNDFHGPITVDDCVLVAALDRREKDGTFTPGSLGDLHNDIYLNGAMLALGAPDGEPGYCLAPSRTIHLGPGGAILVPPSYIKSISGYDLTNWYTIYGKITGPGYLTSNNNCSPQVIIANGDNDYSGGTWVVPQEREEWRVTPQGKLGTGPVLVATECCLTLEGDGNIDRSARLTVSGNGLAMFESDHPLVGSLDGSGYIDLGVKSTPAAPNLSAMVGQDTTLTVGSDNTDFTFWGTIRQIGQTAGDGQGALTKTGTGVFTLHGGQTYSGPTTVEQGTLILKGSLAGDVIVKKGATFIQRGTVAGKVTVEDGAIFKKEMTEAKPSTPVHP